MKKSLHILWSLGILLGMWACRNTQQELWEAIDDLKERVQALETEVAAFNSHVEGLQELYNGATIAEVKESDEAFHLTLTNGHEIHLAKTTTAALHPPLVSIDEAGYWQVSYDNGNLFTSLGVKAAAEAGQTPLFRIDEQTGYWQISYDRGSTFSPVLDTQGRPVRAVSDQNTSTSFFEEVRLADDNLSIKLLNGPQLNIPILKDFLCSIALEQEGIQLFSAGETRRFPVQIRGVESTLLLHPEGWSARLTAAVNEQAELVVTAPPLAITTRATANSTQDIAILATSGKYACITKIAVGLTDSESTTPTLSITNSLTTLPTSTTLSFEVQLSSDADGWKYLFQESALGSAPDAATILATGQSVSGQQLTVESLLPSTSYTIYAVAYAGDRSSPVASITNTTLPAPPDPKDYYLSGVEIQGVRYSYLSPGATLLEISADATDNRLLPTPATGSVTFLGDNLSPQYHYATQQGSGTTLAADHVVIGRYADRKPTLVLGGYLALRHVGGTVVFKNLTLDCTQLTGAAYAFLLSSNGSQIGGVEHLVFEDCDILFSQPSFLTFYGASGNSIGHLSFRNCKIAYTGSANSNFILANQTNLTGQTGFKSLVFENNLIYMTQPRLASHVLFNGQHNTFAQLAVTFTHNTVVNYLPSGGQGAVLVAAGCGAYAEVSHNLYYSSPELARTSNVFCIRMTDGNPPTMGPMEPNAGYGTFETTASYAFKNYYGGNNLNTFTSSPFSFIDWAEGKFTRTAEAAAYGASLE